MQVTYRKFAIIAAFLVAMIVFAVLGWQTYGEMLGIKQSDELENHSYSVIHELDLLLIAMVDAETGQRGYVLTGNPAYLEPYQSALRQLAQRQTSLRHLTGDDPAQQERLNNLDVLIREKLDAMKINIEARGSGGLEAAGNISIATFDRGRMIMEEIRQLISQGQHSEQQMLLKRSQAKETEVRNTLFIMKAGGAFAFAMIMFAFVFLLSENAQRAKTEEILRLRNDELESARDRERLQNWVKTGLNELDAKVRGDRGITDVTDTALTFLASYLNAGAGVLYLADNQSENLRIQASYAFSREQAAHRQISPGEGLVGEAAREQRTMVLQGVPADYLHIGSALGQAAPRTVAAIPLVHAERLVGVMELATFSEFSETHLDFLNQAAEVLAVAISINIAREKVDELLVQSQAQEEELRVQQEELQQSNEELEERANLLEQQREQIQAKNREMEAAAGEIARKAKEVEQISTYKSEFLANMSHELRTPLNSLMILSGHLEENREGNLTGKQVEYAATIKSAGQELLTLINDILDLSKIEAGRLEFHYEDAFPAELCSQISSAFRPLAEQKGITLTTSVDEEAERKIPLDSQRTLQILKNLVSNAVKFTEEGTVNLQVYIPSGEENPLPVPAVAFAVTDTGIGISDSKHEIVFQAFQQADGSTSRRFGGTGLGLSISRELARGMHGEILLKSTSGQGSVFTLYLPTTQPTAPEMPGDTPILPIYEKPLQPQQQSRLTDDRDRVSAGDRSILIIEDDQEFARLLVDRVRERGFSALVATDGNSGIELAEKLLPAAILLDVMLPGIDGWGVMQKLTDNMRTRHIPVHFVTCLEDKKKALGMGGIGFTTKPVTCEDLDRVMATVEKTVERTVRKVLIVEDDKAEATALVALLEGRDIHLVVAGTGAEAVRLYDTENFDCIVLDLGLADMSGFDLLEHLSTMNETRRVPVIVHTGRELSKEETRRLQHYAQSIIIKGAKSPERLLNEVTLFLHVTENRLPPEKQRMIRKTLDNEKLLAGKKVLLVDDDMRNVFSLSSVLADKGMTVVEAENGRVALEKLAENPDIDIVLMDVMMPEMDGFETTRQIRQHPRFARVPVIALTAKAMKGDREECIAAGANDYITKPVDTQQLLSLLRVWLYQEG